MVESRSSGANDTVKRYFKGAWPWDRSITAHTYCEFDGEWATRQVDIVGERWYSSARAKDHPGLGGSLCDQPLSELDLTAAQEIAAEEFERIWQEALEREAPAP
jgi:hypothetical protein